MRFSDISSSKNFHREYTADRKQLLHIGFPVSINLIDISFDLRYDVSNVISSTAVPSNYMNNFESTSNSQF
jgi:hypothetical protein